MYKTVSLHRFLDSQDPEAAHERWRSLTESLAPTIPGLSAYSRNRAVGPHPSQSGASEEKVFFDGYSCAWFADREMYEAATASPEWRTFAHATAELFDGEWQRSMGAVVDERILKEGDSSPFKAVWVLRFSEGIDRAWAREFWSNDHARFVIAAPGVDRYLQNHTVAAVGERASDEASLAGIGFDGFAECWFQDRDAFLRAVSSPEWAGLVADGVNLFDMTALWGAVLEEQRIEP